MRPRTGGEPPSTDASLHDGDSNALLDDPTPIHTVEREYAPRVRSAGTRGLRQRAARVRGDDARPEPTGTVVSLGNAHDPTTRKTIPEKEGRPTAHPGATVPADDEELGDIEVSGIVGCR